MPDIPDIPEFEVIIDDRELTHGDWILTYLTASFPEITFTVKRTEEGDFTTPKTIFERKTVSDLWNSLHDGRFHDQAERLMTHANEKIIVYLIVGSVDAWEFEQNNLFKCGKVPRKPDREAMDACIASLMVRYNFRVICDSNEYLGLRRMIRTMQKIEVEDITDYTSGRNCAMLAARLFGISKKEVQALISLYGTSVERWCKLTIDQLTKIKGFGPAKAEKFVKFCKAGW
jgi:ERCC4-type nuclease